MVAPNVISRTSEIETDYRYGFVTDIESEIAPKGLDEQIVRMISAKKNEPEFLLDFRLKAYQRWLKMGDREPNWAKVEFPPIDFLREDLHYYAAPVKKGRCAGEPRRRGPRRASS